MGKSILDTGWGQITRLIEEKANEHGRTVIRAGRFDPTTQTCSACGAPGGKKALNIRVWVCQACGAYLDRDMNAAVNIMLAAGLAESLNEQCGDNVRHWLAGAVVVDSVHPLRVVTL